MIESVHLTTAQKTVMGQQSNSLKNRIKKGFQMSLCFNIKLTFFFLFNFVSKKWTLAKYIVNKITRPGQFIELHNTQFFKRLKNLIWDCITLFSSMEHFAKIEANLTPENIYIKEQCGLKKHTDIYIYTYTYFAYFTEASSV